MSLPRTYSIDDEIWNVEQDLAGAKKDGDEEDIEELQQTLASLKKLKESNPKLETLIEKFNQIGKLLQEVSEYDEGGYDTISLFQMQVLNEENCKDFIEGIQCMGWSTSSLTC